MDVDATLREWLDTRDDTMEPELQALATALFLEDTFGVILTDADIEPTLLGTPAGVRSVLDRVNRVDREI